MEIGDALRSKFEYNTVCNPVEIKYCCIFRFLVGVRSQYPDEDRTK